MKNWKLALMCLAMVAFIACKPQNTPVEPGGDPQPQDTTKVDPGKEDQDKEADLVLDQTSIALEEGENATITATVEATWASSDEAVASVEGKGKEAVVTALKEGYAIISAVTKGGQTKTCVVTVKKKEDPEKPQGAQLKGSQVWPIILDGVTGEANAEKIVASFQPNDVDQFLYVWEGTYVGGEASGLNFHGNGEGYTALVVAGGWSGCGFCLTDAGNGWEAAKALKDAIVASPDDYFLHLAIKSTDNASHCFYFMGNEATKFVLGTNGVYDGPIYANFDRNGSWQEFDIPMSAYASALAASPVAAGVNVFVALTEGINGAQLNLDAVYFYKK
jgi:hypothetical protein